MIKAYKGINTPFGKLDIVAEVICDYIQLVSKKYNCTVGYIENCKSFPDSLENAVIDWQDSILLDTNMVSDTEMEYTNLYQNGTITTETFEI